MRARDVSLLSMSGENPLYRAKNALIRGDRVQALSCWIEARDRFPELVQAPQDTLEVLLGLQRYDEAEALMQEGCKRAPREAYYAEGLAETASRRGNLPEAIRLWGVARKAFPWRWQGHLYEAESLMRAGQLDEAETLLKQAVSQFPEQIACRMGYARLAERQGNWSEALKRWEAVSTEFKHASGDIGVALALQELGQSDEAEARLEAARTLHPVLIEIRIAQARLAEKRGDFDAEVRIWEVIRERFPLASVGYRNSIHRLRAIGREDDAEAVMRAAIERFPQDSWPAIEYALLAHHRRDWSEAVTRWEMLRSAWPDQALGYLRGADALDALGQKEAGAQLRAEYARRSAA